MKDDRLSAQAPTTVTAVLNHLEASSLRLPKRLKQCAEFTRDNFHLVAVSTVSEMANASGVAPSVYVRFCQSLGFSGYSEMQTLFRAQYADQRPDYEARIAALRKEGGVETGKLMGDFIEAGHKSLVSLTNMEMSEALDRTAQGLSKARTIHLVGLRRAFCIVTNLSYLLDKLGVSSTLHFGSGILHSSNSILEDDAMFAVTYSPFSEETLRFAEEVHKKGGPVFGLSDSFACPLKDTSQEMLIAREEEVAGLRALTASISLTTALAVAIKAAQKQC